MGDNDRFLGRPFFASCAEIDAAYESDAYNSLSIEGYGVTADLIARIAGGKSDLSDPLAGKEDRDALTARGYFEAFGLVKKTLEKLHAGADFGETVMGDVMEWKMALFAPSVKAGLLSASSMAGYRTSAVYIRDSLHVPPQKDKLVDAMKALGELIAQPLGPFSRAVLAHHMLVHIHPFSDGNGRTARFLMNVCLIAGGLPWTVIKTASRAQYVRALDAAHVDNDILPFAQFVYAQMSPKVV